MTRCHWRWSGVALDVIGRSDPAWLRSFYTHTVVLSLITGNNGGGGGAGGFISPSLIFRPLTFSTRPPQASNLRAAQCSCQSRPVQFVQDARNFHSFAHELSAFSLALHFETWPREPSAAKEHVRQRRVAVLHQLVPTSSRCSPRTPLSAPAIKP